MTSIKQSFLSSNDREFLSKFISMLQKCGNKQRALSTFFSLLNILKQGVAGSSIFNQFPLKTLKEKDPIQLIHKSLYNLKPAFLIKRVIKSGRRYDLPVPISENRATFMAINWLRKTALKNNKNDLSLSSLLAFEIAALLHRKGSSRDFLKAYIDIAFDQRPFSRFIKRRRYSISKSKRTPIAARFKKIRDNIYQRIRSHKYQSRNIIQKMNKHHIRRGVPSNKKN